MSSPGNWLLLFLKYFCGFTRQTFKMLYRNYKSVALCFSVVDHWTHKLGWDFKFFFFSPGHSKQFVCIDTNILSNILSVDCFCQAHSEWKFPGQGLNQSHSSDTTKSLAATPPGNFRLISVESYFTWALEIWWWGGRMLGSQFYFEWILLASFLFSVCLIVWLRGSCSHFNKCGMTRNLEYISAYNSFLNA